MPKLKIKMLSRNPDNYTRESKRDIEKIHRNYDPKIHPFEKQREYVRALNATKLERLFAKPFIGALEGHRDGVSSLCNHPTKLSLLLSGTYDGEIKYWHIPSRTCYTTVTGHTGQVRGVCFNPSAEHFISCGDDQVIRMWAMDEANGGFNTTPKNSITCKEFLYGIDHHWFEEKFATCGGSSVHIWDTMKNEPIREFTWGADSVTKVKFNPIEDYLVAACGSDRSITLYDIRGIQPVRKVILKMRSNSIAWNPMEAYTFTVANEDFQAHQFDMRYLKRPCRIYPGHVNAVLDIDYSPTGKEFVTASYDRTMRIFSHTKQVSWSRDVYHLKRMQTVSCVKWSRDNQFIVTGSDESVVRIWKSNASEKLGVKSRTYMNTQNYNEQLKKKFAEFPQIKRIASHRHVPKYIYNKQLEITKKRSSIKRKEEHVVKYRMEKPKPKVKDTIVIEENE